jgi:hypothetical protein
LKSILFSPKELQDLSTVAINLAAELPFPAAGGKTFMTQLVILWAVLGIATLALALYRKFLAMHEDTYVHVSEGEQRYIPGQVATFKKIGAVDRWGISLTILTAIFGLGLAAAYVWQALPYKP